MDRFDWEISIITRGRDVFSRVPASKSPDPPYKSDKFPPDRCQNNRGREYF
jgi:hypothetical protein